MRTSVPYGLARRGQLDRPFWRRAGIWWMNLVLGLLFAGVGVRNGIEGPAWLAVFWLVPGLAMLAAVPVAYRQNVADVTRLAASTVRTRRSRSR